MAGTQSLASIFGDRESGKDVRTKNVAAVRVLSNILKSSLGPQGLDKMLVDDMGEVTITNDGATILRLLEVEHPAARVLVDLSDLQDKEVGDGTTSVVLIAAELLQRGQQLVQEGTHPTNVIAGFKLAMREAVKYIQAVMAVPVDALGREMLEGLANTTLSSKYCGEASGHFAKLVVDAILGVKVTDAMGTVKFPVKSVNVLKTHGESFRDSSLADGYALCRLARASQAMPQRIQNAKIALLDFNLRQHRMQLGVQVQVEDPAELEKIRQKEKDVTKAKIAKIIDSGANVILTSQGIDDMSLKYFVQAKMIAVRRVPKRDLQRIARATGGKVVLTLASLESDEEVFDASSLGTAAEVTEERVGDEDYLFVKGCSHVKAMSIVLRGANEFMLDELERSVHDALCAVSKALESKFVVPGGGAVEAALSIYLEDFARTLGSREQLAIAEFADALLVIPRTLAINAAQDATELVARLRMKHHSTQLAKEDDEEKAENKWCGLDLVEGKVRNNMKAGVLEPAVSKVKSLRFATEAAVTILRIDDLIKLHPEPEQQQ